MGAETEKEDINCQDKILSSISHDLKSPVCAIIGITNFLIGKISKSPGADQVLLNCLTRISAASEQTLNLISDITLMARLKAGKGFIEPYWVFNLGNEFSAILETFSHEADVKMITMSLRLNRALPPVLWDMRRLRYHAINNVVSNAVKYTPRGGYVSVIAYHENMNVVIRVEDNGPGIPPQETNRIFSSYEQIDLTSARVHRSAGLGLSNAKRYVELHGGKIYVDESYTDGAAIVMEVPELAVPSQPYSGMGRQDFLLRGGETNHGMVSE